MWESIPPTPNVNIQLSQKITWAHIPVGTKVNIEILRYTDFEWEVHSPDNDNDGRYPSADHTLNKRSGNYLLLDGLSPQKTGDRAVLVSDHYDIDKNRSFCLSFYYFMNTPTAGGDKNRIEIYQSEGNGQVYKIGDIRLSLPRQEWLQFNVTATAKNTTAKNMWFYLVGLIF